VIEIIKRDLLGVSVRRSLYKPIVEALRAAKPDEAIRISLAEYPIAAAAATLTTSLTYHFKGYKVRTRKDAGFRYFWLEPRVVPPSTAAGENRE
jgi:hypothetical protein